VVSMNLLIVAVVLLWVVVLGLAVTVFALTRQIGVLFERVAPAGALALNKQLKVEDTAPTISVKTLAGETIDTGSGAEERAQLLLFVAPDCPVCKSLLPVVSSLAPHEPDVEVILASDGDDIAAHEQYVSEHQLHAFPYVVSEALGVSYGVSKLPYAVLIRANGTISSLGVVSSRGELERLFEPEARSG
jgi:methylamine dehydrogenase accessory protein MauD